MHTRLHRLLACFLLLACLASSARASVVVRVTRGLGAGDGPIAGRLVVALATHDPEHKRDRDDLLDAPFWTEPQPVFGVDLRDLNPGDSIVVDDSAEASLMKLSELPPGKYEAVAWVIVHRQRSSWRNVAGNIHGQPVIFDIPAPKPGKTDEIALTLDHVTKDRVWPADLDNLKLVEVQSDLLTKFHGRPVKLSAGIVLPDRYDPSRTYGAVYEVPGFSGDHFDAVDAAQARRSRRSADTPSAKLTQEAFYIVLDPESPNGHHLFADSENNGPVGQALVTELIPAIEKAFPSLRREPAARLLRGHSSGGWSVLWLITHFPETFGFAWSTSPDPVDFRRFETTDIYNDKNLFIQEDRDGQKPGEPTPAYRRGSMVYLTVAQETGGERALARDQMSGQQWHSWQAVFGPRVGPRGWGKGHPAAMYNERTGELDHDVTRQYLKYDLVYQLHTQTDKLAPIWKSRVRLVVGDADSFYLNEACRLLDARLRKAGIEGVVSFVPKADHFSIYGSSEVEAFPQQMLDALAKPGAPAHGDR